jgi:hypothetical protein
LQGGSGAGRRRCNTVQGSGNSAWCKDTNWHFKLLKISIPGRTWKGRRKEIASCCRKYHNPDHCNLNMHCCVTVCYSIIDTPTNAPLVYYTVVSLHVSTLLGHHQGYTKNTKSIQFKIV